ncbi:hypothetical protein BS47DRAFT_1363535 [Hydnum rufescens UP504]|uniref:Uncharacterized protein n=1 Tax=Hydnum rufescens UP504 TaxID=1448309 RepID=A0A9P6ATZ2_9AGAM|nr:hypothetical protein BS47DRAFT_1363535 [Hydnum rufescens UP504]
MTWSKDGDAEAVPVNTTWSDLFNNQGKLETYSRSQQLLLKSLACCYLQKEWSLVFTSSQRHFQYFSVSSTLHPPVHQAGVLDSVFGVMEYPHHNCHDTVPDHCPDSPKAAAAAAAKYFAAMKKWDEQNVDVTEYIVHVEVPLVHVQHPVNWFIRPHLGYPGELDHNDHPLCEAASCILPAGEICETDVVALWDFLGHGPWPAAQAYKVPKFYYKI